MPTGTLAHASQAVKGSFPLPQPPGALLCSLQAGAAWVRWKENGRPGPYFPLGHGQGLLHTEGMGTVECGAIVPDTACRWITATTPHSIRLPLAWHHPLRMVGCFAPRHALTHEVQRALLGHCGDWMTAPGAPYPQGSVLEQLTPSTPRVRYGLHGVLALTDQLTHEVLDLALEPLRVLWSQAHIPLPRTSNPLVRLCLRRRAKAAQAGGVVT